MVELEDVRQNLSEAQKELGKIEGEFKEDEETHRALNGIISKTGHAKDYDHRDLEWQADRMGMLSGQAYRRLETFMEREQYGDETAGELQNALYRLNGARWLLDNYIEQEQN